MPSFEERDGKRPLLSSDVLASVLLFETPTREETRSRARRGPRVIYTVGEGERGGLRAP